MKEEEIRLGEPFYVRPVEDLEVEEVDMYFHRNFLYICIGVMEKNNEKFYQLQEDRSHLYPKYLFEDVLQFNVN